MSQTLNSRVAIVTGSSRGIGREFALRLAREGADVVVSGRSATDSPHLPGTIHSVAEEVQALGRRALPIRVDVRDEQDIKNMVERTMEEFGRIDILINNAGALWWENVLDTPPARVALMFEVNLRASYLASYYALPHMVAGGWGHIVMNSPPVSILATPGHAMYYCMKMGMTRLAIGIAAEHAGDNVAANSLWPAAPIESYATLNWPEDKMGRPDQWRVPAIMCDALMEVLGSEPGELTGRQLIDETLLRERGWTDADIDKYWLAGKPPAEAFWIDERSYPTSATIERS
ncbi:citronellol/citronellal dehydrogenase [Amycolatopsis sulphurea]|uniref:Citronellol/citronellal dehydrogenase n=1 Tax=Amycolatopsis sulphurea TaxID=76022 RepID=A0A2A9FHU8_9PSEU|nr:SDR family oxidoreductase [Amycolatopsis sulphurea]PFG51037.1 citronellol/citronellal dehydrogenase [Amycolatopsis sulphurea]